jgi:cobalt-zinc-cadmium efflux system membrane fusion protein
MIGPDRRSGALALEFIVASLLSGTWLGACRAAGEAPVAEPPTPPPGEVRLEPNDPKLAYITVDTVAPRTEKVVAVLPAQLVVNEDHTVRIASPVTGRVRTLGVELGQRVQRGQALMHIASSDVGQAESDLLKAQAALAQASATLNRARDLYQNKVVALKDLQQAESDEAQARAERDRAAARVNLLGASTGEVRQEFVLRSPIDGEVVERNVNAGAEVRSDNAQTLVTISSLDTLWLTANAYQRDLAAAKKGDRLAFTTDAAPGRRYLARVQYVGSVLDPQTRTATIRAVLPNPDHALRTQVFGDARLLAPDSARVPVAPVEALVTHGSETVVYVEAGPGHFVRRPVTVGEDDGQSAAILSGLRIGERIVTRGSLLLDSEASGNR